MSRPFARLGLIAVVGAAGLLLPALPARSADVYAGKTIDIIVGSAPGGGYDIYSRTIARHMAAHIPGNPAIIVKNMPGAGSGRTAQFIASIAPKDGTVIGAVFPGAIINPLLDEHTSVKYQPVDFAYLGTADNGTRICATYANSKIKTFADARARKAVGALSMRIVQYACRGGMALLLPGFGIRDSRFARGGPYRCRRFSFSTSVVRFRFSSFAACPLLPPVRSRER